MLRQIVVVTQINIRTQHLDSFGKQDPREIIIFVSQQKKNYNNDWIWKLSLKVSEVIHGNSNTKLKKFIYTMWSVKFNCRLCFDTKWSLVISTGHNFHCLQQLNSCRQNWSDDKSKSKSKCEKEKVGLVSSHINCQGVLLVLSGSTGSSTLIIILCLQTQTQKIISVLM